MKLSQAIDLFDTSRIGEVADSTRAWARPKLVTLIDHLGDPDIADVTTAQLRQWRVAIKQRRDRWKTHPTRPTSDKSISQDHFRNHVRAVKQLFKWLYDEEILDINPSTRIPVPPPNTDHPKAIKPEHAYYHHPYRSSSGNA